MMPRLRTLAALAAPLLLVLAACGQSPSSPLNSAASGEARTRTTVATAEMRSFETFIRVTGEVTATQGSPALAAEAAGKVAGVTVSVGDTVKAGQLLAWLEPADAHAKVAEAQAEVARLEAQWADSARVAAEQGILAAKDYVSRSDLERAHTNETAARQQVSAGKARLAAARAGNARLELRAPYDATIAAKNVQPGDYARAGDVLFQLARAGATELALYLPESSIGAINPGTRARIIAAQGPYETTIRRVQPTVDAQTRSFKAFATNPAPEHLVAGRSLSVQVVTDEALAVAVPESALVLEGTTQWLYVVDGGHARKRRVLRVAQDGAAVGVTGVQPGERFAVSGAAFLRDGGAVEELSK